MTDEVQSRDSVEVLAEEFLERFRRGERPSIGDYQKRFPELAERIGELFPLLAWMEQGAPGSGENPPPLTRPAAVVPPSVEKLGDFRIIREIGRGGMGVVYEAEQESLGRRVALKVLPRNLLADAQLARRFAREARAAARLHHSNIVPVFGVGEQDGLHYYVMQYIDGLGLDKVLVELRRLRKDSTVGPEETSLAPDGTLSHADRPTFNAVTVEHVALSLVSGCFTRSLATSDAQDELSGAADPVRGEHGAAQTLVQTTPIARLPAPDTAVDRAEAPSPGSGSFTLPGQSEHSGKAVSRTAYWQSVARIGVQAGQALQYAHEQTIVHRDIKPANLLLDSLGVTWVTDFGLAKLADQQDLTQTGDVLGTLRYMAPEQFNGQTDARSDVYSLGLTLYELLALQPAFQEPDRHKLIHRVTTGVPARLRSLDPRVPRDLETIVHKAIDRDPAARYQSAGELAADLERFLSDEPIQARRISLATRFGRWCRRNPAVSSLTGTIALLLLTVTVASTFAAARFQGLVRDKDKALTDATIAKNTAQTEKQAADKARDAAQAAADREKALRKEAEQQKLLAQTNFARARRAVNRYLDNVTETELLSAPGLQPLREQLLASALEFYDELTKERTDDPTLLLELAGAHYRLGRIHAELGNYEATLAEHRRAIELFEQLRRQQPENLDIQSGLAHAFYFSARYEDTTALCKSILEIDPKRDEVRALLADAYNSLAVGDKKPASGAAAKIDAAAALAYHQQSLTLRESLVRDHPDNAAYLAHLSATLNNLGVLLAQQQKLSEALAMYERGNEYVEQALKIQPHSVLWGQWLCIGVRNAAFIQARTGASEEASKSFQRLVSLRRNLAMRNPALLRLQADLYRDCLEQGRYEKSLGHVEESLRSLREARRVLESIHAEEPLQLAELAAMYASLSQPVEGDAEDNAFDEQERSHFADLAVKSLKEAIDKGYSNLNSIKSEKLLDPLREREDFRALVGSLERITEAEQLLAASAASDQKKLDDGRKAEGVLRRQLGDDSAGFRHRQTLAAAMHSIGVIQIGLKQYDEAENSLAEALALRQQLQSQQPDDPIAAGKLIRTRVAIGQLHWERRNYVEAHRLWQACLAESLALSETHRGDRLLLKSLAGIDHEIYARYASYGLLPLVHESIRRSVHFETLTAADIDGTVNSDLEAAAVLLDDRDLARRFFEQYARAVAADPTLTFSVVGLARSAAASGDMTLLGEDLLARARKVHEQDTSRAWAAAAMAMVRYRQGNFAVAQVILSKFSTSSAPQVAFLDAAVAWKLGDEPRARRRWSEGEASYRKLCARALSSQGTDVRLGVFHEHWWQFQYGQLMRRLAAETMAGDKPQPDDPWKRLLQARGFLLIGENQKADAELAAAIAAAPGDVEVWMARARLLDQDARRTPSAEADWRQVVDLAPSDPMTWIQRGCWYAEQGQHERADADFAKAASLTPQELNRFLDAGWWVLGPYPPQLGEFCPPELDPDPSRPTPVIDSKTGLSTVGEKWRRVTVNEWGDVSFGDVFGKTPGSSYALAYVFSPQERTALVRIACGGRIRLWVNGELVLESAAAVRYHWAENAPIVLRGGRNVILVKAESWFSLSLGDRPEDGVLSLAEQLRFQEAAELLKSSAARERFNLKDSSGYATMLLPLALWGEKSLFEAELERLLVFMDGRSDPWVSRVAGQIPNAVFDAHADKLIAEAEKQVAEQRSRTGRAEGYAILNAALVNYRAGRLQKASDHLAAIDDGSQVYTLPLQAMLAHRQGDADKANRCLDEARALFTSTCRSAYGAGEPARDWPFFWWYDWLLFQILLREAETLITGDASAVVQRGQDVESRAAAYWKGRDPVMLAFDHAVLMRPVTYAEQPGRPWLSRGRRFAQLGRFEQAEADFDKAVQLAPQDFALASARAAFLADQGRTLEAADAFSTTMGAANAKNWWDIGRIVEFNLAQHVEVLEELLQRKPHDTALHRIRGESFARNVRWADARRSYSTGDPHWAHEACSAALSLLIGDEEGFRAACQRQTSLLPTQLEGNLGMGVRQVEIRGLRPADPLAAADLLRLLEQDPEAEKPLRYSLAAVGLARYRKGDFQGAIESLEKAQQPHQDWQRDAVLWPVLAMAHWRLEQHDLARKWLHRSQTWIDLTHGAADIPSSIGPQNTDYNIWLCAHVLYLEAKALIDGAEAAEKSHELWIAAAQARTEKLEAQRQARAERALAAAEAAFQSDIDAAPQDPLPWIRRGRWRAERGEQAQADADFTQAASLTPNELNKFLEAGWWLVGPYASHLDEFCPPELDPDPSKPMLVVDSVKGLSELPLDWRSVPVDGTGRIAAGGLAGWKQNMAYYALTYVYSPDDRTVVMGMNDATDAADPDHMVWVNGERTLPVRGSSAWPVLKVHYPLALRAGRNTLLIKTILAGPTSGFVARLEDHPLDRSVDMARFGLFDSAVEPIDTACRKTAKWADWPGRLAPLFAATASDRRQYERIAAAFYENQRPNADADPQWLFEVAWLFNLGQASALPSDELRQATERWRASNNPPVDTYLWRHLALATLRIGDAQQALDVLAGNPKLNEQAHCRTIRALALQKLGRSEEAREQLDRAQEWFTEILANYPGDGTAYLPDFFPTFREAHQLIHGETAGIDRRFREFLTARRQLWEQRDPLTAAFDDAVRNAPAHVNAYINRGRRLASLGRIDQAQADFRKATELGPKNLDAALALANFLAQHGDGVAACNQFEAALGLAASQAPTPGAGAEQRVEREFSIYEKLNDEWLQRANDARLWRIRGERQLRLEQWRQAAESLKQGAHPSHTVLLARLYCLLGDESQFLAACRAHAQQLPAGQDDKARINARLSLLSLRPVTGPEDEELTRQLEEVTIKWSHHVNLAAALYRRGRYVEAMLHLEQALPAQQRWQGQARVWPLLAMVQWRLGNQEEARRWLARCDWWVDLSRRAVHLPHAIGPGAINHPEWLQAHIFYREAKALIENESASR